MKKTLVALAVAAVAATSANAAVVYDNDGSKVEVKGSLRVLLAREGNQRTDLQNDGSRIEVKAQQDLNNGLKAFAAWQLRFDDGKSFGNPTTKRLFGGFAQDGVGTLSFGKQVTNGDDVQFGDYAYVWGGNNNLTTSADKSVKFRSADFNGFSFGLDYIFGNADKTATTGKKNGYGAAVFYTMPFGNDMNMNLAAGYGQDKDIGGETKVKWRTAAEFEFGPGAIGVNYGESKTKGQSDKTKYFLVGAKYAVTDMSTVAVQYKREKVKNASAVNAYVVSADYKLHKNVVTFVEFARDTTNHTNAYGAGLRVFF